MGEDDGSDRSAESLPSVGEIDEIENHSRGAFCAGQDLGDFVTRELRQVANFVSLSCAGEIEEEVEVNWVAAFAS